MHYTRREFEDFLKTVDLAEYRRLYRSIKIVEMDLDKYCNIVPLDVLYKLYWEEEKGTREIPTFEQFYKIYTETFKDKIREFWEKSCFGLDCDCFPRGLKARINRTWISIITQIHAGYVAEEVFGAGNVKQSTELDRKNIDILVNYSGKEIKFQIKKSTNRKELRRMSASKAKEKGFVYLKYEVVKDEDYETPKYTAKRYKGKYRPRAKQFIAFNRTKGFLDRYDNGFIVFTERKFLDYKAKIDSGKN